MPLLNNKVFRKSPLPKGLLKQDEVFYCAMTNEIFREYEEFCQRIILCNSMVWTCSLTGKMGLTFSEAVESEENATQTLKDFPTELKIPILFLASKTYRASFTEMFEDIYLFIKDRYFIGENVEASFTANKWERSHILQVIAPSPQQLMLSPNNGCIGEQQYPAAPLYRYEIEQLDAEDEDISEVMLVTCNQLRRNKNCGRDKYKLFLKQHVEQNDKGFFVIKQSVLESFGINKIKFEQIFDGPVPNFCISKKFIKSLSNGKKSKQETITQFLNKNNYINPENTINLLEVMRKREEEYHQFRESLKQKKADEKLAERQKQKEENTKISIMLKEWYKPKEDLELEDHKKLPVPTPLKSKIPEKYIGDVLVIIEFVHSFSKLLHSTDFFPCGLTLELVERALLQKEVAGPLIDIIQMFLTSVFNLQNEEASQCTIKVDSSADLKGKDVNDNVSLTEATYLATKASNWSISYQGLPLHNLPLYAFTTTEILRLHLLSSGARVNESAAKWRYQHRGGYASEDDPALYLRLKYPHVLKALSLHYITELPVTDKLKVIHCLINQILTFADVRDLVEDRLEKSRQAKLDLKTVQITERRQEQEFIATKFKIRKEGRDNKKDVEADIEKLTRDADKKRAEIDKKMKNLMTEATKHQILLGHDRAFRKYLKLESIPSLLVNSEEDNPGYCFDEGIKQVPHLVGADRATTLTHVRKIYDEMNTSDKENIQNKDGNPEQQLGFVAPPKINGIQSVPLSVSEMDSLLICNTDFSNCLVHSAIRSHQKWSFYHNAKDVEELCECLNKRGVRESELQQTILNEKDHLVTLVTQTPASQLNPSIPEVEPDLNLRPKKVAKPKYEDPNLGHPPDTNSALILQLSLIENILEMEEKIFAGNLGQIKVKDRNAWREHISNKQFENLDKTLIQKRNNSKTDKVKSEGKDSRSSTPDSLKEYKDPGTALGATLELESEDSDDFEEVPLFQEEKDKLAIQSLAIALVQIGQGVESQYLRKPLGHSYMRSDSKNAKFDLLDKWEQSLLASTSYSQIFLHYTTLDNCILWSRSSLLARCQVCRKQSDSENMLLCDSCNKGHHLYCLKPKLTSVPEGEWFCKDCQKRKDKEEKLNNPKPSPPKKRRIFKEEEDEDSCEESTIIEESEDDQEDEDMVEVNDCTPTDSEDQEGSSKMEICSKCNTGGTLLCCDNCPSLYHLECTEPPLRRVPRGDWFCNKCKAKKSKDNSDSDFLNGEAMSSRRNNRRETDDLPLHNAPLQELLTEILKQEDAWPFIRPVQKVEVPDYYDIITKPMDFGTIKYKLNMGEYKCDSELMADAALVFENCCTYNNCEDEVYKCGIKLLKCFKNKCRDLGLKIPEELYKEVYNDDIHSPAPKKMRTE